jgi:hypothetical protein
MRARVVPGNCVTIAVPRRTPLDDQPSPECNPSVRFSRYFRQEIGSFVILSDQLVVGHEHPFAWIRRSEAQSSDSKDTAKWQAIQRFSS